MDPKSEEEVCPMATLASITTVHITFLLVILEVSVSLRAATAPGDLTIGGIFPIHEDVDKGNKSFKPHTQSCIR